MNQTTTTAQKNIIAGLLSTGRNHARTGRQLARALGCDIRAITAEIERERRDGLPICATSRGDNCGYYLAADQTELQDYCDRLAGRAGELSRTRAALMGIIGLLPAADPEEET